MKISVGFDLVYDCPQPTPMILTLSIHYSRVSDLLKPDHLVINPPVPIKAYRDGFGNWCSRIVAPKGEVRLRANSIVSDPGTLDRVDRAAQQHAVHDLPEDTLVYLLGSRYCETDRLSETAWALFGNTPTGWGRVQAICDFVHQQRQVRLRACATDEDRMGSVRRTPGRLPGFRPPGGDLLPLHEHPRRYCTGYLGDIGVPPSDAPMDFSGWFEAFLGSQWHTFDARSNVPRIGRVLIAHRPRRFRRGDQHHLRARAL